MQKYLEIIVFFKKFDTRKLSCPRARQQAGMIALARTILYDPHWPWHAAAHLGGHVKAPDQYLRCQPRTHKNLFTL